MILDRDRAQAPIGVEHPRFDEGGGRAGVEAGRAGAAVVHLERCARGQVGVGEQHGQQKITAGRGIDEHRVLAKPAEAGEPAELAFWKGRGIDEAAGAAARHSGLEPGGQRIDPAAQQIVVVVAPGIPRHPPLPRRARPMMVRRLVQFMAMPVGGGVQGVVGGEHDHAAGAVEQVARVAAERLVLLEPIRHHASMALVEPAAKLLV